MIELAIAAVVSGTVLTVANWARGAFSAYLSASHPDPVPLDRFEALEHTVRRHDRHLIAQGMRNV